MCGEGKRFKDAGYDTPKPLLEINNKKIFRHAADSLDFSTYNINVKYTFIVRKDFYTNELKQEIYNSYENSNIVICDHITRGSLETLMLAKDYIKDDDYIISLDCDIAFDSKNYIYYLYQLCKYESELPIVMSFYSKNPAYSYVKVKEDDDTLGILIKEKQQISTYALGGCYGLSTGKVLKRAYKKYLKDFENKKIKSKELYTSLVINYIIQQLKTYILIYNLDIRNDHYWSFGVPDDYEKYSYDRNIWNK